MREYRTSGSVGAPGERSPGATRPSIDPGVLAVLERLGNPTPGDFAVLVRRARVLGAPESAEELVRVLRDECEQKREGSGLSIGF